MSTTRVAMDQVMDDHFKFEAAEDMASLLGTVTDDVLHDQWVTRWAPARVKTK